MKENSEEEQKIQQAKNNILRGRRYRFSDVHIRKSYI